MLGSRNMSQYGGEQSVFSELSEFGANKSMVSLSVYTEAQSSLVQASLALNSIASFGKQAVASRGGSKLR